MSATLRPERQAFGPRSLLGTILLLPLFWLAACSEPSPELPPPAVLPEPYAGEISFHRDVRPIVEATCLSCHGCFDAPCQLNMENAMGLIRGAHPLPAYDGTRTEAQATTRLGQDALDEAGWRALGFHPVLEPGAQEASLMERMLAFGKQYPFPHNTRIPEHIELGIGRRNACVANDAFEDYQRDHPLEGMPHAVTGLSDEDYALLVGWLRQGAVIDTPDTELNAAEAAEVARWEALLNRGDERSRLVARWLYEHLFLAHLYFEESAATALERGDTPRFFELLRSRTPPGEAVEPIATRRPNDDPGGPFHYRLRPIEGAIAHKRHITYALGDARLARIEQLFFEDDWAVTSLPGYGAEEAANPFVTFADIPAQARYQFMLDEAGYFVRTFIRGPVCRGQIATDVIRDHFWAMFQNPASDLYLQDAAYRERVTPLLAMPGQDEDLLALGQRWRDYKSKRNDYTRLRAKAYAAALPQGAGLEQVWDGDGHNTNALLTILRHHDSATVARGLVGQVPQTVWLMDYPLLERTYYELVVNFDVFGNVAHQLKTRLYFDLIRNGAELNYLRLLPAGVRGDVLHDWYQGSGKLKLGISYEKIDNDSPSALHFATDAPAQELGVRLLETFAPINAMAVDPLNRCDVPRDGGRDDQTDDGQTSARTCGRDDVPAWQRRADRTLANLAGHPARHLPGIRQMPEVTFLRVHHGDDAAGGLAASGDARTVYTLTRDRAHSNVAFIFGEELRYQPDKDRLTLYAGILGSYPNFIFDVPAVELERFVAQLGAAGSEADFRRVVEQWGIRRTHRDFWHILADITAWHRERDPLEAGVFDINRYQNF